MPIVHSSSLFFSWSWHCGQVQCYPLGLCKEQAAALLPTDYNVPSASETCQQSHKPSAKWSWLNDEWRPFVCKRRFWWEHRLWLSCKWCLSVTSVFSCDYLGVAVFAVVVSMQTLILTITFCITRFSRLHTEICSLLSLSFSVCHPLNTWHMSSWECCFMWWCTSFILVLLSLSVWYFLPYWSMGVTLWWPLARPGILPQERKHSTSCQVQRSSVLSINLGWQKYCSVPLYHEVYKFDSFRQCLLGKKQIFTRRI